MLNPIVATEPFVAALMEALSDAKKAELIAKCEKALYRRDGRSGVRHTVLN